MSCGLTNKYEDAELDDIWEDKRDKGKIYFDFI